jgi:hypothetical protein
MAEGCGISFAVECDMMTVFLSFYTSWQAVTLTLVENSGRASIPCMIEKYNPTRTELHLAEEGVLYPT